MRRGPDPAKVRVWTRRLAKFEKSRQTVAQFCRDHDESIATFYYWKKKLAGVAADSGESPRKPAGGKPGVPGPSFQPLEVSHPAATSGVTVRMPSGIEIELGDNLPAIQWAVDQILEREVDAGGEGSC